MKIKLKKLILSSIIAFIVSTGFVTTISASTAATKVDSDNIQVSGMPLSIYVSDVPKNFSKTLVKPPRYVWHTEYHDGVRYAGELTLTHYADADTRWLAYYSGTIKR